MIGPAVLVAVEVAGPAAQDAAKASIASTGRLWGIAIPGAEVRSCTVETPKGTVYLVALALPLSTAAQRTRARNLGQAAQRPFRLEDRIPAGVEVWALEPMTMRQAAALALAADASTVAP